MLINPEITQHTWANKPATAPLGQIICITDIGDNGSLWRGDGTKWVRLHQIKFSDLTGSASLTGTTSETTLFTLTLPAGVIGSKGKVKLYPLFTATNNGNIKNIRIKLNSLNAYLLQPTGFTQMSAIVIIRNFNSESSQKIASGMTAGLGLATASMTTMSIDTSLETTITVTGQLSNSSDTLTLESLFVELA